METQLKVVKANGSVEDYFHTKVIGTISCALAAVGQADVEVAEELAEVVTYYLYHKQRRRTATSCEILSIIKGVLAGTQYEEAATALSEHHWQRKLKRSRIEVVWVDLSELDDAVQFAEAEQSHERERWDKSRIVADLVSKYQLCRQTARTIASMVEEKIIGMGLNVVPASLIKQLVLSDAAAVLRAHRELQTA